MKNLHSVYPYSRFLEKFKEVTLHKLLIAKFSQRQQLTKKIPSKTTASPRIEKVILIVQIFAKQSSNFIFQRTSRWFLFEVMQEFMETGNGKLIKQSTQNLIPKWIFKARFKRRTLHVPNLIPIWVDPNN